MILAMFTYCLLGTEPLCQMPISISDTLRQERDGWRASFSRAARRGEGKKAVIRLRSRVAKFIASLLLSDNDSPEIRGSEAQGKESVVPIRPGACAVGG